MPDNILGDVLEQIKDTAGTAAGQASPTKIVEAGLKQITGQQGQMPEETVGSKHFGKQLKAMKTADDTAKQTQLSQIRQNLQGLMQPPKKPAGELPKNISGATGMPKTVEEWKKQQEKIQKQEKKLPDLSERLKLKNQGSGEAFRGVNG